MADPGGRSVCGNSLAEVTGSNPAVGHGCLYLVKVVCCQAQVSSSGRSLVQRSPIECECLSVISKPQQ
jgi:hypothetical protein